MADCSQPHVLISTDRLAQHLNDSQIRVMVDGAVAWSWKTDLSDPIQRDITSWPQLKWLLAKGGIDGDNNN
jgi:hypothetical protein